MKESNKSDEQKIAEYRAKLGKYVKPSVTADIVVVKPAYGELKDSQWRENPKFALEMLLIKRGQWPYEGCWALPGGFIRPDESVEEGACRELKEETGLVADLSRLIPVGVFSDPKRDMRTWVISNAFVSVRARHEVCAVKGGDDAASAQWLRIEFPTLGDGRFNLPFYEGGRHVFSLLGTYIPDDFIGGRKIVVKDNPLAFDHAKIIVQAFLRVLTFDLRKLALFFLPEKFTLASYIGVYQYLARYAIEPGNIPNFRRQLIGTKNPLLEPCEGEFEPEGRGHATAKLYRARKA